LERPDGENKQVEKRTMEERDLPCAVRKDWDGVAVEKKKKKWLKPARG